MLHYAEIFTALGSVPRIQIVRLLLGAFHLGGMTVGEIQTELGIPGSTLNHHLEKLKKAGIVCSRKEKQWIWYSASAETLEDMLAFLFGECCTRSSVVPVSAITTAGSTGRQ
jgi:ATP-dependent Clp protease ATP-binding subunit ClpC